MLANHGVNLLEKGTTPIHRHTFASGWSTCHGDARNPTSQHLVIAMIIQSGQLDLDNQIGRGPSTTSEEGNHRQAVLHLLMVI
jgi:hypothetical protein